MFARARGRERWMHKLIGYGTALVLASLSVGCMSTARVSSTMGLERSLYPGLGDLDASQIKEAFKTPIELHPPLSAGIVWLEDAAHGMTSEYSRSAILKAATTALNQPPFKAVGPLPTTVEFQRGPRSAPSLDAIRGAAAKFQHDVAFILQTGMAEESGVNPFAIGYLGLVTAPLFPGTDISVAAGAEVCAVDVRSGVMLGCGVGNSQETVRFLFPLVVSTRRGDARDRVIAQAVTAAAQDALNQVAQRIER